ncbi:MAG: lysophospholipid acyltransferase family protein, partial [Bacteroidota bacterium]
MKVLYFISDIIYLLLYYLIGYRKKVVRNNLKLSFPKKSKEELLIIEKKTFHHFIDIFMEIIKSFTISQKEISKRFTYKNIEVLKNYYNKNESIIMMTGHYANWEWTVNIPNLVPYNAYAVFNKIGNKYFEKKVIKSRTKFGAYFIPTSKFINLMQENFLNKELSLYGMISDQSPRLEKTYYWNKFMGINVPIHTGAEMLAKKFDYKVIYLKTERVKRGYYESTIKVLAENPKEFTDYQITDLFLKELESQIKNKPEFYFWTHKRFKHMGKEN